MLKRLPSLFWLAIVLLFFPCSLLLARMTSDNYIIFGDVIGSGGTSTSTSATYGLHDTIAEALILSATTTSSSYGIKAGFQELYPDQFVTLSTGATSVEFGTLDVLNVKTGSHTMTIDSNAGNGVTITVSGATLSSSDLVNTITAIGGTPTASTAGSEQFGINLVANTLPSIGANRSGTAPLVSVANNYNTTNLFTYSSGNTVATSTIDTNSTVFTVSYIANISATTEPGWYYATLVYSAIGNF